ncbi:hypothetical protein BGZ83_008067 [Gryganskiella cystojenkinii]|nr:hypothetical protein BGZ83_008067 [Gryganskiella cystojenkinii]
MTSPQQQQLIAATLAEDQDLQNDISSFITSHPDAAQLMTRVLAYFQARQSSFTASSQQPDAKRPKLEGHGIAQFFQKSTSATSSTASSPTATTTTVSVPPSSTLARADIGPAIYSTSPLSFLHPVRKKLVLSLHKDHVAIKTATPTNQEVICQAPYSAIHRVVAVPFLERTTKQTALILWFRHADLMAQGGSNGAKDAIWAVPLADDGKDFSLTFHDEHKTLVGLVEDLRASIISTPTPSENDNNKSNGTVSAARCTKPDQILISVLAYMMHRSTPAFYSCLDLNPSPSTVLTSGQGTPAYPHFSTHLKSNQGTMYLLPTGLLFAFRKPILFLPTTGIEAIGVHSVMTRTFDFEVVLNSESCSIEDLEGVPPESSKEAGSGKRTVGFSMVDRKEFERVEDWIKKSGIRDRSLSEDLKAKDKANTSAGSKKRNRQADGEEGSGDEESGGVSSSQSKKKSNDEDDDDDEEDEDFAPESDEDHVMEEYDSNPGESGSGSEGEEADGDEDEEEGSGDEDAEAEEEDELAPSQPSKPAPKAKKPKEVDLGEESLGDDSEDDEEDDEEEEEEEDGAPEESEVEEDELEED